MLWLDSSGALPESECPCGGKWGDDNGATPAEGVYRFTIGSDRYEARNVDGSTIATGYVATDLRQSWRQLGDHDWPAVAKGAELLHWDREHRYCSRCGAPLQRHSAISKRCPGCGMEIWPSPAPAVIVLIEREGEPGKPSEALLVHARTFRRNFYGLVAGFVETGEDLERAVAREISEETGLIVDHLSYFGSQSWPFPFQLMIGFTARVAPGSAPLRFLDGELDAGGFFSPDNLPELASPPSLARRMIDSWLQRQRGKEREEKD